MRSVRVWGGEYALQSQPVHSSYVGTEGMRGGEGYTSQAFRALAFISAFRAMGNGRVMGRRGAPE
jgi:hypothetical protein